VAHLERTDVAEAILCLVPGGCPGDRETQNMSFLKELSAKDKLKEENDNKAGGGMSTVSK